MISRMYWGHSGQRRVHTNVPLISWKGPEDDPALYRLRDAIIPLLDTLEGDVFCHDLSGDIQEAIGRLAVGTHTISIITGQIGGTKKEGTAAVKPTSTPAAIFLGIMSV